LAAGGVSWTVYLLRCRDGSLYTGITKRPAAAPRVASPRQGERLYAGASPGRARYQEVASDRGSALKREAAIRRLSRVEKLALCSAGT